MEPNSSWPIFRNTVTVNTIIQTVQELGDQEARNRFAQEIDVNFSVIAPAGVGKTTAIVQRIVNIANSCDYRQVPSRLSKLLVVTYTQKAADEMRSRAHQALLKANVSPLCFAEFNKAFFGTIHSYCLKLIQAYGPQIGVPSNPSLLSNDTELWFEFLNKKDSFVGLIPDSIKDELCKHTNFAKLSQLARRVKPELRVNMPLSVCPRPDLTSLLNYIPKRSAKKTLEIQKELRNWWIEYKESPFALEIPEIKQGDSDFKELCAETFAPLWNWLGDASLALVVSLAQKYRQFRIQKGFITYDDMVGLAEMLLSEPYVISAVGALDYHVILDEAQDTDSQQFSVLLGVASSSKGRDKGRFCMLGDPQQAIYSSRANLSTYLKLHNDLLASKKLQPLTFNVTMRCDKEIVKHCNELFPLILKDKTNIFQTNFVPLSPRPWAQEGFVGKIQIHLPEGSDYKLNTEALEKHEATVLAHKIRELGYAGLGINDWSQAAILAPRKSWLAPIAKALQSLGIPTQIHSRDDIKGDNPAIAWLTGLLTVVNSPNDSFELVGVLREVFGISDDEIAFFVSYWNSDKQQRHPLSISRSQNQPLKDPLKQTLDTLHSIRNESLSLSLSEGVRNIINKTQFRDRLASLPDYDTEELLNTLDKILVQATLAEEQGCSLKEFTETLRENYNTPDDPMTELQGHIQFYTSHKAKGLEWPVVIVPFLFRSILFPPQEYPQLISIGNEHDAKIAISDHPDKREFDALLNQHRISELERLLYVTATRARNKLFWIDDETLFPDSQNTFGSLLKIKPGGENRRLWNSLETQVSINLMCKGHEAHGVNTIASNSSSFDPGLILKAKNRSKDFLKQVAPSQLNQLMPQSGTKKIAKNYSPIEYGNWWHEVMETLPWQAPRKQWISLLAKFLINCPEPSRGEFELQIFFQSSLYKKLYDHPFDIHTEIPFLFKNNQGACCGGVIDFLACSRETKEILIIDWKTDLLGLDIDDDNLTKLKEIYSPQLAIYKEIVEKTYKQTSKIFIFSTPLGKMIEC